MGVTTKFRNSSSHGTSYKTANSGYCKLLSDSITYATDLNKEIVDLQKMKAEKSGVLASLKNRAAEKNEEAQKYAGEKTLEL